LLLVVRLKSGENIVAPYYKLATTSERSVIDTMIRLINSQRCLELPLGEAHKSIVIMCGEIRTIEIHRNYQNDND
jgi:hypothetical protein